jgi:flagellar motor switch protein FliN/FliY
MDQSEIDALMQGIDGGGLETGEEASLGNDADNLSWDDVKEEMEKSQVHMPSRSLAPTADVTIPQFDEMVKGPPNGSKVDLDFVLDIPLTINVELGRNRMLIGELLQLGQGSVVELTKLAGEPMDIFVNGRLIARGEVVVVNEKFGVRLTDIVSPAERINKLK